MSAHRSREPRQPVRIGARLKSGLGWSDVVLRNVSARGVMGECAAPPARGDYVEVRCGAYVIVARVAWAADDRFGARAQEAIELSELIACAEGRARQRPERRRSGRGSATAPVCYRPTAAERHSASLRLGRLFEFGSLVLGGAAIAGLLGGAAHDALARPVTAVSQVLSAGSAR